MIYHRQLASPLALCTAIYIYIYIYIYIERERERESEREREREREREVERGREREGERENVWARKGHAPFCHSFASRACIFKKKKDESDLS